MLAHMRAHVQGSDEVGYLRQEVPDVALLAALAHDMAPLRVSGLSFAPNAANAVAGIMTTSVGTPIEMLSELVGIKAAIRTWYQKQPDEVLREASAYTARLTEVWTELRLLEQRDRQYLQLRTMQVQPVLDEIDRQLKISTSRIAMLRQDLDAVLKGGGA